MFCEKCGREIPEGFDACVYCSPPELQVVPTEQKEEKKKYQYAMEYVKNGFFFGGSKINKIKEIIDTYSRNGWRVVSTTYHQSIFLLIFHRCGTIITFEKERDPNESARHRKHTKLKR